MPFLLDDQTVFQYLYQHGMCDEMRSTFSVQSKICKNFNLRVQLSPDRTLLVKQEPHNAKGQTNGDLAHEWTLHQLVCQSPQLSEIRPLISVARLFDEPHSILVFDYLEEYCDLEEFYTNQQHYPTAIATAIGHSLATLHRATFDRTDYRQILERTDDIESVFDFGHDLKRLTPEAFGTLSGDALKFHTLYQRHPDLQHAIAHLNSDFVPCCLIHNDLKFSNFLLYTQWQTCNPDLILSNSTPMLRVIDWEKWLWGDPALDVGTLLASYLKLWLKSVVVNRDIDIQLALRLATTPLEQLQPSMVALMRAYLASFPAVVQRFPDFVERVLRFAGMALIESILARLHYYEPFGNTSICLFQVAKTLLSAPAQRVQTVFGMTLAELVTQGDGALNPSLAAHRPVEEPLPVDPTELGDRSNLSLQNPVPIAPLCQAIETASPLDDLIHNIHLQPGWVIVHPRYSPLILPETAGDRFLQLPQPLQHSYLRCQLRNYLYDIYFSGEQRQETNAHPPALQPALKNDTLQGINLPFYQQLQQSNRGQGYFDSGWVVQRASQWTATKQGLTLHIQPHLHLHPNERSPAPGQTVRLRLPHNWLEAGFYGAVGNAGFVADTIPAIEISFNVSPAGAIALMQQLTEQLNAIAIPFSFKVLLDPDDYSRYDAAILQVERQHYGAVYPILMQVYETVRSQIQPQTPLFTYAIAAGVGLAEEPEGEPTDFGLHRCQIVADALLEVWQRAVQQDGTDSPTARRAAIHQHLVQHGIDPHRPHLNPGSDAQYPVLFLDPMAP